MKIFAPLRAAAKTTTNLVGIPVNPNARTELLNLYKRIDNALSRLPETSGYRVGTKSLIQDRLQLLQTTSSDAEFETKVGLGQVSHYAYC